MKKRTVKILTGLAIMLVAWGVIYTIWVGISATKLRRVYAALEQDGRPMRAEEVIPPAVEDVENAALLYESAALLLKAMPARWDDVPDEAVLSAKEANARDKSKDLLGHLGYLSDAFMKESLEEDRRATLEALLADDRVNQALAIVKLGTERPSCRFDLEYEAGPEHVSVSGARLAESAAHPGGQGPLGGRGGPVGECVGAGFNATETGRRAANRANHHQQGWYGSRTSL